jgi:hypothetical protein
VRRWTVIVLIALGALTTAPAALADVGESSNWAGYAVHGTAFRRVSASWRQPGVACVRSHAAYSAYWVGLGGFSTGAQALEQIGTEADCNPDGTQSLSAWYEMVPAASMPIAMTVSPGDRIDAEVTVTGHRATLWLRDRTRRHTFRTTISAGQIDVTSAEWIVEAPSDCLDSCLTLPLANFGTAVFTGAHARAVDGRSGTVSSPLWASTRIRLSPTGAHLASTNAPTSGGGAAVPSGLSAGGTTFTVSFTHMSALSGAFPVRHAALIRR